MEMNYDLGAFNKLCNARIIIQVLSTESNEEPTLQIKTRSSVYNVGEKKAIYCEGNNVPERIEWISPNNEVVEGRSTKNTRIYVERKENEPNLVALIIHSTKVSDSGNWTCKSGDLSKVLEIVVGVKVNMLSKSEQVVGDEGNSAKLNCKAEGDPQPVVQWYRNSVPIEGDPEKYVLSTKDHTYSLEIKHLAHDDTDEYMCRVTQKALSHYVYKTFPLSVRHKPILFDAETNEPYPIEDSKSYIRTDEVFAVMNKTKEITCSAIANPPPTFNWYKRKNNFDQIIKPNPDLIRTTEDGMSSTLILRMLEVEDVTQYKCVVSNKKGQVAVIFDVIPASAPVMPDHIMATESNSSHITFNVTCSNCTFKLEEDQPLDAKNLPIQGYTFQLVPFVEGYPTDWDESQSFDIEIETADGTESTTLFPVGPLSNKTMFYVRVRSFNAAGHSDWLDIDAKKLPSTTAHAVRIVASLMTLVVALFLIYN